MAAKKMIKKQDIKDWFIIQRIRILNIIKEHKYLSAGIGVFLLSCLVYLVAFATDDPYKGKITATATVAQKGITTTTEVDEVKSFSKIIYEVSYNLSIDETLENELIRNEVIIEATFNEGIDASWVLASDEFASYKLSEDKRTLTVTMYSVKVGEKNTKQLYLNVNNIKGDTDIESKEVKTTIKVKESTSEFSDEIIKGISIKNDKQVPLTYEFVDGEAYNSKECPNGRCVPFGIVVGFGKDNLILNDETNTLSMEGIYFDTELNLILNSMDDNQNQLDLLLDKDSYGLYSSELNLIKDMPSKNPMTGEVSLSTTSQGGVSGNTSTISTPKLYLLGEKTVTLKVDEEYEELGIQSIIESNDEVEEINLCLGDEEDEICTIKITKDGKEVEEVSTEDEGTYKITYEYDGEDKKVILKRTVKVEQKDIIEFENGEVYSLVGNQNITLLKGDGEYEELGIHSIMESNDEVEEINLCLGDEEDEICTIKITKDGKEVEEVDIDKIGTYVITYSIFEIDENEEQKDYSLTRTIKVVEEMPKVASQVLSASTVYAEINSDFVLPAPKLDNENISSDEKYKVTYYSGDDFENPLTSIDSTKPGTYYVVYSVVDKNGFDLQVINTVNFQTRYKFNVKNIKIDGSLNYYKDNFVVVGTYYVNVNSIRNEDNEEDIVVTLSSIEKEISSINKYYSEGEKVNNLIFYTEEHSIVKEITDLDKVAYGEKVILKSQFEYLKNGDDNLTNVMNIIDLSKGNFTKDYFDTLSDLDFYLSIDGKRIISQNDDGTLNYESGEDTDGNKIYETLDNITFEIEFVENDGKLNTIMYSINELSPGSIIDFRIRLTNGIYEHSVKSVDVSSNVTYTQQIEKSISKNALIYLTPYKARSEIYVNNCNYDIFINGADKKDQISTWSVYPSINMPIELINTNIAGFNTIKQLIISVILPKGINYVYNENYELPSVINNADGTTTLKFMLSNLLINEWIEPLTFETSYDIDIKSGSVLTVQSVVDAISTTGVTDTSSLELRTSKRNIIYQNNEELATTLYTSSNSISKDREFDVNTKIYRNNEKDFNNLSVVTVLPYNDGTLENDFDGYYSLSNLSNDLLCTTKENITTSDFENSDEWFSCGDLADNDYEGVTAIKANNILLNSDNKYYEQSFNIIPIDNSTNDIYTISAYIITPNEIKEIPKLTVNVVSKKIQGIVWEDFDTNGLMDKTEKRIPDIKLNLYNADTDELVKSTLSDATGKYVLSDLDIGRYYIVAEYNTLKYGFTTPFVGGNKSINSSFDSYEDSNNVISPDPEDKEDFSDSEDYGGDEDSDDDEDYSGDEDSDDDEDYGDDEDSDELKPIVPVAIIKSDIIEVTENTKIINNINLGLTIKKIYSVKIDKFITKAVVTNNLGVTTEKDFGKATLAKLDVKDLNNLNIKVIYTIELENIGYYPGYVYGVRDYIPDGMSFNENYEENKDWVINDDGYIENKSLFNNLLYEGDKKYLTLALDITRKEAGSFVNTALIDEDDLQILVINSVSGSEGE